MLEVDQLPYYRPMFVIDREGVRQYQSPAVPMLMVSNESRAIPN
jgi:hypothetical protein